MHPYTGELGVPFYGRKKRKKVGRIGKTNGIFVLAPRQRTPCGSCCAQRGAAAPPERPAAKRSVGQRGLDTRRTMGEG